MTNKKVNQWSKFQGVFFVILGFVLAGFGSYFDILQFTKSWNLLPLTMFSIVSISSAWIGTKSIPVSITASDNTQALHLFNNIGNLLSTRLI